MSDYTTTIGIECHVQLKTKTKLFATVSNDARDAEVNTLVSPLCFGMPGTLPYLNEEAVRLATKAGIALKAEVAKYSKFDRKHYFYPDLPLGYQITQFDKPIVVGGSVTIKLENGETKVVGVERAHLEADAGKSTHPAGKDYSLVDLNRVGTPLLEIVSKPDMHSPAEAKAYAEELYVLMLTAGVGDCDLYHGNMRFDVNVSVSKDDTLGTRTETKNLNSFKSVEKAVEYETKRQIEVLESGGIILQETRGWNDDKLETFSQRSKEDAQDYRYFPDPDLPPIVLDDKFIDEVRATMPMSPGDFRAKFSEINLDNSSTESLLVSLDAKELVEELIKLELAPESLKRIANWLAGPIVTERAELNFTLPTSNQFVELSELVATNKLSSTGAKSVLSALCRIVPQSTDPISPQTTSVEALATSLNLIQESDNSFIVDIVAKVISENPKVVEDIKAGNEKASGFLVGQVMKLSQGKANPGMASAEVKKQLSL
jgi:aspartyl-tRNA(Asn)/glutamyl-tRNA(Gln) amidotransferase subunit B